MRTDAEKRDMLRRWLAACPACCPEMVDGEIAPTDYEKWLRSHMTDETFETWSAGSDVAAPEPLPEDG